jgi:hypothetical protein
MKEDVSPNPINVALAGAARIVFKLYSITDLVEELLGSLFRTCGIQST